MMGRFPIAGLAFAATALCQSPLPQPGGALERTIAPGEVHTYPLDLPRDQVRVVFRKLPFAATLKLTAADGKTVAEGANRFDMIFSTTAALPGHYSLEISLKDAHGPATYFLKNFAMHSEALTEADRIYYEATHVQAPAGSASKLEAAAALYGRANEPEFQGSALMTASRVPIAQSDWSLAADRITRASAVFQASGSTTNQARAQSNLGAVYGNLRDYPKSIEAASRSLPLAREHHLQEEEIAALTSLGTAYSRLGDPQRGLDFIQQALVVARGLGNLAYIAQQLNSAGSLHRTLGNYDRALDLYRESLQIQHDNKRPSLEAVVLNNMGTVYREMGDTGKALEYYQQVTAIGRAGQADRLTLASSLFNSGGAHLSNREPAKALLLLEEALAIFRETANRWDEASALTTIGHARHALNDPAGAATILADALTIRREVGDPHGEAQTRFEIARLERTRGNLEAARGQVAAAIEVLEPVRNRVAAPDLRSSFLASVSEYYGLHVDVLMQLYRQTGSAARLQEARDAAERGRARNLADVLAAARVAPATARDPELAAREQKLRQDLNDLSAQRTSLYRAKSAPERVAAIDKRIDATWTEYQAVRSKLFAGDPQAKSLADPAVVDLDDVRREALDPGTLLLEYSLGDPRSYLWAISTDSIRGFELPARAQIEEGARVFWDALKSGLDAASVERAATGLSQMTLAPARDLLANKRLLIVADGALQYVPFAALADPAQTRAYRPLIAAHEVVHEPSATTLALLRRGEAGRKPAARSLAIFADPVFEPEDPRVRRPGPAPHAQAATEPAFLTRAAGLRLARLAATRQEARSIAALLPESERWLALDFDASRDAATSARLSDYRILHFATHGVLESAHPELSALALSLFDAQGQPRDGFLRLYEIYNLKIQADLVVLSACQTALGKNVRGEGLVGLARGFMHAGAPRVVASLWKVDDRATSELMRLFYAAMLGPQKKTPAAALRAAQIAISRQEPWRSPYYWAAFVLQGEWK